MNAPRQGKAISATFMTIVKDSHFLVPFFVLVAGIALLAILH